MQILIISLACVLKDVIPNSAISCESISGSEMFRKTIQPYVVHRCCELLNCRVKKAVFLCFRDSILFNHALRYEAACCFLPIKMVQNILEIMLNVKKRYYLF